MMKGGRGRRSSRWSPSLRTSNDDVAILDANVLYSASLRHLLFWLAITEAFDLQPPKPARIAIARAAISSARSP